MRTFWKYFLIIILLLIGLCAVGVLYLFFVPGSSLFGITYISYHEDIYSRAYATENISKVELNSRSYQVNVVPSSTDEISLKVYSNSLGFVLTRNSEVVINESAEGDTLIFNVAEPYGLATANSSYIELRIPAISDIDITLTNRNATTNLNSADLIINNLTYRSDNGDLNFNAGEIKGSFDIELGNADFTIGGSVVTNNNNVTIAMTTGQFSAQESILGDFTINRNNRGVFLIKQCNRFGFNLDEGGGRVEIETVANLNITSSDTNVYVDNIVEGATIRLTQSGRVEIGNVQGYSDIITNDGAIHVGNSTARLILQSNDGHITVDSTMREIEASSAYGDISITFNEQADSFNEDRTSRTATASTNNGKITLHGAENININIAENGRAEIYMNNVYGENILSGNTGEVYLVINENADNKYTLITQSTSGNVSVDLAQFQAGGGGYHTNARTETLVHFDSGVDNESDPVWDENVLTVSTASGSLLVRDSITVDF